MNIQYKLQEKLGGSVLYFLSNKTHFSLKLGASLANPPCITIFVDSLQSRLLLNNIEGILKLPLNCIALPRFI